jgi:HSP20 family molecular chaperone IbpA
MIEGVNIMEKSNFEKRKLDAGLCSCVDDEKSSLHLEFTIPGVKKEDINLRLNNDSFRLRAEKNDIEYVSTGNFCCPVDIEKTDANYENGLLLIDIPLKDPWEKAYSVAIH